MPDNLQETIRESAKAPAKASGDAGSVEQHKLTEQLAADKYLASKAAASQPKRGRPFNNAVIAALTASINALLALIADMNAAIAAVPSGPWTDARKAALQAVLAKIGIVASAGDDILNP